MSYSILVHTATGRVLSAGYCSFWAQAQTTPGAEEKAVDGDMPGDILTAWTWNGSALANTPPPPKVPDVAPAPGLVEWVRALVEHLRVRDAVTADAAAAPGSIQHLLHRRAVHLAEQAAKDGAAARAHLPTDVIATEAARARAAKPTP